MCLITISLYLLPMPNDLTLPPPPLPSLPPSFLTRLPNQGCQLFWGGKLRNSPLAFSHDYHTELVVAFRSPWGSLPAVKAELSGYGYCGPGAGVRTAAGQHLTSYPMNLGHLGSGLPPVKTDILNTTYQQYAAASQFCKWWNQFLGKMEAIYLSIQGLPISF